MIECFGWYCKMFNFGLNFIVLFIDWIGYKFNMME